MVQAVVKGVAAVASAVADAQRVDFDEFDFQYQSGSRWLAHAFDVRILKTIIRRCYSCDNSFISFPPSSLSRTVL